MRRAQWAVAFGATVALGSAPAALAEPAAAPQPSSWGGSAPPSEPRELAPLEGLAVGQKRPLQDYDGRQPKVDPDEVALWIPRILFFPAYVVSEYLLRTPLGAMISTAEKDEAVADVAATSDIDVLPTLFVDLGFLPNVGVYFAWNNFVGTGNDLRASFSFGGIHFWRAALADRIPFAAPTSLERSNSFFQIEADFLKRGDLLFWGIGPRSLDEGRASYGILTAGAGGRIHLEPWRGLQLQAWVNGRYSDTDEGICRSETSIVTADYIYRACNPATIRRRILDGSYPIPPHYARSYATVRNGVKVALDSRDERPAAGSGAAIDLSVEQVSEVDERLPGGWFNYGAIASGYLDLTGTQRVLGLTVEAQFQNKIDEHTQIPFTELVGTRDIQDAPELDLMRGFQPGRLLGSSALVATLDYRWPIWAFMDGTLQAAVGNAFARPHLEDFDPVLLRFSFVGGVRASSQRDYSVKLLAGFGTDTFEEGGSPSAFRLVLGGTTGF